MVEIVVVAAGTLLASFVPIKVFLEKDRAILHKHTGQTNVKNCMMMRKNLDFKTRNTKKMKAWIIESAENGNELK